MPKMMAFVDPLTATCGVNLIRSFVEAFGSGYAYGRELPRLGGADLALAGFINTPDCKKMYDQLAKQFNIVYQSSVRMNTNSGRQFFIVIYDGKKPKPKKAKPQPVVYNLNSES